MAATLGQVKNSTNGTLVVVSGDPNAHRDRRTVISKNVESVNFTLGDSKNPMQVFFHGKIGGADRNGLLVLLSFESSRITARLGCNPIGSEDSSKDRFESGGKVFMEFVENKNSNSSSLEMKIYMNTQNDYASYDQKDCVLTYNVVVAPP